MPKVLDWHGYKFFFFSNEGMPLEPCHIHIRKAEKRAKFWIDSQTSLAGAYNMNSGELIQLQNIVQENIELIRSKWNEHFGR